MKEDWSVVNRVTHARGLKCRRRGSLPSGGFGVRFTGTSVREAKPKEWSQGKEMPFASQLYQFAPQTALRKQQKNKRKCCERLCQWRVGRCAEAVSSWPLVNGFFLLLFGGRRERRHTSTVTLCACPSLKGALVSW